jgi:hypothetical protein
MKPILMAALIHCALRLTIQGAARDMEYTPDQEFEVVKDTLTRTRAALQQFSWNTHTVINLKGQVQKVSDDVCRYGPDGTVYKTPLATPPPQNETRGLRKRAVKIKTNDVEDSVEEAVALAENYVPPSPQKLEALFQAANALLVHRAGSDQMQLEFKNYLKPGDFLVLSFDPEAKSLRTIDVTSYLSEQADVMTLHVVFENLPDGTNYVASSVLNAAGRQLQVKTENGNYVKVWQ